MPGHDCPRQPALAMQKSQLVGAREGGACTAVFRPQPPRWEVGLWGRDPGGMCERWEQFECYVGRQRGSQLCPKQPGGSVRTALAVPAVAAHVSCAHTHACTHTHPWSWAQTHSRVHGWPWRVPAGGSEGRRQWAQLAPHCSPGWILGLAWCSVSKCGRLGMAGRR